jgi:hypothetical protein
MGRKAVRMSTPIARPAARRDQAVTIDSWADVLVLVREPDRHGHTVYNVRLHFGTLPPWRYGPVSTEEEARRLFSTLRGAVSDALADLVSEVGVQAGVCGHEEF